MAIGLVGAGLAEAQPQGLYAGVALSRVYYKEEGFPTAHPLAIVGKLGNQFTPNVALEARFALGVTDDDVVGLPVALELDNYYGAYGKAMLPISPRASLYGLVGFTRAKVTASGGGVSASASDDDVSFGFGGEFGASPTTSVNVEWARLVKSGDFKIEALSLGVNFRF